jgi:hypothetical protein
MTDTNAIRAKIASELNRPLTDLFGNSGETFATVVNRSINDAISHYENTHFRWNQIRRHEFATTAAGVRAVSLPATFLKMDTLAVKYGGNYLPIRQITIAELDLMDTRVSATSNSGLPSRFAIYGNLLQLYPAPGGAYTLAATYIRRTLPTSATGSYTAQIAFDGTYSATVTTTASHNNQLNGWTSSGEGLVRARATASIKTDYLLDPSAIAEMQGLASNREPFLSVREAFAFKSLAGETFDALSSGRIVGYAL